MLDDFNASVIGGPLGDVTFIRGLVGIAVTWLQVVVSDNVWWGETDTVRQRQGIRDRQTDRPWETHREGDRLMNLWKLNHSWNYAVTRSSWVGACLALWQLTFSRSFRVTHLDPFFQLNMVILILSILSNAMFTLLTDPNWLWIYSASK